MSSLWRVHAQRWLRGKPRPSRAEAGERNGRREEKENKEPACAEARSHTPGESLERCDLDRGRVVTACTADKEAVGQSYWPEAERLTRHRR
jgi:hypothetical protein